MKTELVSGSHSDFVSNDSKRMKGHGKKCLIILLICLLVVVISLLIALLVGLRRQHEWTEIQNANSRIHHNRPSHTVPECMLLLGSTDRHLDLAKCVLDSYPLIDGHNDLSWQFLNNVNNKVYGSIDFSTDIREVWNTTKTNFPSHTDIPRLRQGKVGAQ
ncbi:hypothetical protein ACJMK2_023656, partial [Sinanodonta woodiana]